ncbi:MAG: TldD/PmbA family protein [Sedimentisphaerales bacterium]|nr:TldD/PmbA family protein [Sedimentisphaerales bacterium]
MTTKERLNLAQWTIDQTLKAGAQQAAASISHQRERNFEYRDKKLETLKDSTKNSLNLQIYVDNRFSEHTTNNLNKDAINNLIEQAVASTKFLAEDTYRSLPDPKYYPRNLDTDLKISDESIHSITTDRRKKIAAEIEAIARTLSDKIISVTSWYYDSLSQGTRLHSNGFAGDWESTWFATGSSATVTDPAGGRPEDWFAANTRFFDQLPPPEWLAKNSVQRALDKIGQAKIASGAFNMIVENRNAGRLLRMLTGPMSARALQQKQSFLEEKLNQKITSEKLTLVDNPLREKGLGSRHFDGEGLAAAPRTMIENGVLKEYYIDNYYGKKLNLEPNSGSTSNLIFDHGDKSLDELIAGQDKAILVNNFIGGNFNSTTGDFSFGIMGKLIENGKIIKPVNEMNISGNANDLWHNLTELARDPYPYAAEQTPSLLFQNITFSGI